MMYRDEESFFRPQTQNNCEKDLAWLNFVATQQRKCKHYLFSLLQNLEVSRILPIFAARLRSWRRVPDDGRPVSARLWVRQTLELFYKLKCTIRTDAGRLFFDLKWGDREKLFFLLYSAHLFVSLRRICINV